jgi:phospholipid/cholesterol/gamma-HCH transport system substrate-binding protein
MDSSTRKKIMIGILSLLGGILFFIGIFFIGKKENLFSATFTVSAIFKDINGVKKGNYVYYAGYRAGIVQNITFINDSLIKVDMKMDQQLQHLIKKDSKVYIATEGLVGDKIIQIKPIFESTIAVNDNDILVAINPFDTHEIINKLLSTNNNATVISDNLAKLSISINKPHKGLISTLYNDSITLNDFTEIVHSLKTTGKHITVLSSNLKNMIDHIDLNKGVVGALLSDTSLKRDINETIKNLNTISAYSLKVSETLNNSMQNPNTNNAIGVLLKDSIFAKNLKDGIENFKTSTSKLDQNMVALSHNILLRKYFKKNKKDTIKK